MNKEIKEFLNKLNNIPEYYFLYIIYDEDEVKNFIKDKGKDIALEDVVQFMAERIDDYEIIYYSNAINFLKEKDPSLYESLALADEYGFSLNNLNSEILATLLIQKEMHEELQNLI